MAVERDEGQRLERPAPYRLPIPPSVVSETALDPGGAVALRLAVADGYPRLACRPGDDADGRAVTRQLSARPGEDCPGLTLPAAAVEAGGFVGTHAVPYAGEDGRLYVGLGRTGRLDDPEIVERERAYVSVLRDGELAVSLSGDVAGPLSAADRLAVWLDVYEGSVALLIGVPSVAPSGTVEVTPDPNTGRESSSRLSLYVPRVLGRLCRVGGETLRWGRTADGNRLVGVCE